jgi:hypothetical protein
VGGIISFWWAASFRYGGRHHLVLVGGFARNQHQSSKNKASAASFVVSFVMAWSPFQRANAGIIWIEQP